LSFSALTDLVLLLLIFFLLSSSFVIHPGIKVQLPKSATAEVEDRRDIVITLTEQGTIFLNNDRVMMETLAAKLLPLVQNDKDRVIVINADRAVSLQSAVQVMDIAKAVGALRFLIATQPGL
jgi:biopolymer transport protein ExbD